MSNSSHNPKSAFSKDQLLELIADLEKELEEVRCDLAERQEQEDVLTTKNERLRRILNQVHRRSPEMSAGHLDESLVVSQSIEDLERRLAAAERKSEFVANRYADITLRDVLNGSRDLDQAFEITVEAVKEVEFLRKTLTLMRNYCDDLQIPLQQRAHPAEESASLVSDSTEETTTSSDLESETPSASPTLSEDDASTSTMLVVECLLALQTAPSQVTLKRKAPEEGNSTTS